MAGISKVENIWQRFGSMINTGLILSAVIAAVWKGGGIYEAMNNRDETNAAEIRRVEQKLDNMAQDQVKAWEAHQQVHKDRLGDVKEREGRYEQRFIAIEKEQRRTDQLEYRLNVQEQQSIQTSAAIKEFSSSLNSLSGDVRVVKEILQRLDQPSKAIR